MLEDNTIRQIRADYVVLSGPKGDFILRPSYDKQRSGGFVPGGVASFQPPGFQPPGFQPPGFPQQGFNPGFPNGFNPALNPQPFQPPPQPAPASDDSGDANVTPPPMPPQVPFPGFRGPLPHGRP
jgi:hypothetical protein